MDQSFHTLNLSFMDNTLALLAFAFLIALFASWAWIKNEMTVERFIAIIKRLLALSITLAGQLYYLRLDTLMNIATAGLDANDARSTSPRPTPGMLNPISTAPRFWPRRQRSLGVNSQPPEIV